MRKWPLFIFFTLFCSSVAWSDAVGVRFGVAAWQHEPSGTIEWQGTTADLETGLNVSENEQGFVWLMIEHPVPGLPNIGLVRTSLTSEGAGTVTTPFNFGGTTFSVSDAVDSSIRLDQTDLILYYELIDTKTLHFDLGVNVRYIDGEATVTRTAPTAVTETVAFKGVIPMVYGNLTIKLPFTGVYAGVEGSTTNYQGSRYSDVRVKAGYKVGAGFGIEGGYRRQNIKLDSFDADVSSDFEFSGLYLGVFFKF